MSVLSIEKLRELAEDHELLGKDFDKNNFQPSSYDLRIGTIYKDGKIISHSSTKNNLFSFGKYSISKNSSMVSVKPSEIIILYTLEEINMPEDHCGTVFAINNLSSKGFLILNPGHIDPGFKGPVSICAINLSKNSIPLNLGDKIFTLTVHEIEGTIPPDDKYSSQEFESREKFEQKKFKSTYNNMSRSFFDLITEHKKSRTFLAEIILNKYIKKGIQFILIIAGIIGGIAALQSLFPESIVFNYSSTKEQRIDSLENQIDKLNSKVDSLQRVTPSLNLNDKNEVLKSGSK